MSQTGQERIVIIGAGPAGVVATAALVQAGLRPVMIDEERKAGGQIYRRPPDALARPANTLYGFEAKKALSVHQRFDSMTSDIDYRPETTAFAVDRANGCLHVFDNRTARAERLAFTHLLIASGATDRILPFPGWTLPGVYSLGGAQICLKGQGAGIGKRVVFAGTGPLLYLVAYQYLKAGLNVAAVVDTTPFLTTATASVGLVGSPSLLLKGLYYQAVLRRKRVPIWNGVTLEAALGEAHVEGIRFRSQDGQEQTLPCDAVGFGYHIRSETQLAQNAGCRLVFRPEYQEWLPEADEGGRTSVEGVYVAGDGRQTLGADAAELSGALAAGAILHDLDRPQNRAEQEKLLREYKKLERRGLTLRRMFPVPYAALDKIRPDTLLCRCEAVTAGEFCGTVAELDVQELNQAKALTRVGMGRCQGRFCQVAAARLLSSRQGRALEQVGYLRVRAPIKPVPITEDVVRL